MEAAVALTAPPRCGGRTTALWFGAMYLLFGEITTRDLVIGPLALGVVWLLVPRMIK